jgi:PncC family amidohydrolase
MTFRVAVSESCTGGNIQSLITANSGVSQWFSGGICTYNINIKNKALGVPYEVSEPCNCVGPEVASLMALGTKKLFDCTMSVSTTGYVNPTANIDHPYCFIGVSTPYGTETQLFETEVNDRDIVQNKMSKAALEMMCKIYGVYKIKFMEQYDESVLHHFEKVINTVVNKHP